MPAPPPGDGPSLDHVVGAQQERSREGQAEGLRGLEVDDQLELGGLLDRQIGGLAPFRIRST